MFRDNLVKFLKWAVTDGQALAKEQSYSPLPKTLVAKVQKTINSIELKAIP